MQPTIRPLHVAAVALLAALLSVRTLSAQVADAEQLAELTRLTTAIKNIETRIRVPATHRVWSIGRTSSRTDVKLKALSLLEDPINSASDHIRMPTIYAVAEIAASSTDMAVKVRALQALRRPLDAGQEPVRLAAIDALNSIVRSGTTAALGKTAVALLAGPVRSVTNGVRMPAINALVRSVEKSGDAAAYDAALDHLGEPLKSMAATGGMEVRLMALAAVECIGMDAAAIEVKSRALGIAQSFATDRGGEDESRARAKEAATAIRATIR